MQPESKTNSFCLAEDSEEDSQGRSSGSVHSIRPGSPVPVVVSDSKHSISPQLAVAKLDLSDAGMFLQRITTSG